MWEGIAIMPRQAEAASLGKWRGDVTRASTAKAKGQPASATVSPSPRKGRGNAVGIAIPPEAASPCAFHKGARKRDLLPLAVRREAACNFMRMTVRPDAHSRLGQLRAWPADRDKSRPSGAGTAEGMGDKRIERCGSRLARQLPVEQVLH